MYSRQSKETWNYLKYFRIVKTSDLVRMSSVNINLVNHELYKKSLLLSSITKKVC